MKLTPLFSAGCPATPYSKPGCTSSKNNKTDTGIGWYLSYTSRVYADGKTTFLFHMPEGSGKRVKDLSHLTVGIGNCPKASINVKDSSSSSWGSAKDYTAANDPTTCVEGVKWDIAQITNVAKDYSITIDGDVPLGMTTYSVKAGRDFATFEVDGPCYCSGAENQVSEPDADVNNDASPTEDVAADISNDQVNTESESSDLVPSATSGTENQESEPDANVNSETILTEDVEAGSSGDEINAQSQSSDSVSSAASGKLLVYPTISDRNELSEGI